MGISRETEIPVKWSTGENVTGISGWGFGASPVLHGRLLIVNASVESGSLVALDRLTGKEVWRAKGIRSAWSTPLLLKTSKGPTELVVSVSGRLLAFNPDTVRLNSNGTSTE